MVEFFYPANTYTQELAAKLSQEVDLTVACRHGAQLPSDDAKWLDIVYEGNKGKVIGSFLYAKSLMKLAHELKTGKYDILHVQFLRRPKIEVPYYLFLKRYCKKLVHTIHNPIPHEASEKDKAIHIRFYKECDEITVHNEYSKKLMMEEYGIPEEKIVVMPIGVYTVPKIKSRCPSEGDPVQFLQFGQIREYKGLDVTLQALAKLPDEAKKRIHVTVSGKQLTIKDKTDYPALARELGVDSMVTFNCEHISDEELMSQLMNANVCLVPYKMVYGSATVMMAYAYGKPLIASDIEVLKEMTDNGKTGVLFHNGDAEDMARAILECLAWQEEDYERFKRNIQEIVDSEYNWDYAVRQQVAGYQACLNTPG